MSVTPTDHRYMAAAIRLARRHQGLTATNPSVACLLVRDDGTGPHIVGSGVTAPGGRPHAEPIALAEAAFLARGATAYVTLEPCAHHGSTPPCARTLIEAGVARVFTALVDPDNRVNSKGHAMLREAGIKVIEGVGEAEAMDGLSAYLIHKTQKRPQVTLKLALSADGYLGIEGRGQVPVTGPVANAQSHLMRARHHAILVGSGTLRADDPALTCRLPGLLGRSPTRVILDASGGVDMSAKAFDPDAPSGVIIASPRPPATYADLRNAEVMPCEAVDGRIALPELLEDLGSRGIQSLMVEGGAATARSFLEMDLVDELVLYRGANAIGAIEQGRAIASPIDEAAAETRFAHVEQLLLGDDVMNRYRQR